jgi:ABC-type branched-subunit amino acid transport system ATPase component
MSPAWTIVTALLETRRLRRSFGALQVANDINFSLNHGARHALIGPNGAGKTTFVNLLTGQLRPSGGTVFLNGEDVTRVSAAGRVRRGLGRTFQINTLFRHLAVLDNVALAIAERRHIASNPLRAASREHAVIKEARELLATVGLEEDLSTVVRHLPHGKQRLVEMAITLGLKPTVLLLDEPAAGIPSVESHVLFAALSHLPPEIAILLIEHDMEMVFRFATRITVLVAGTILMEGTPEEVKCDSRVRDIYLGAHAD